jgi:predicted dehydrogenase
MQSIRKQPYESNLRFQEFLMPRHNHSEPFQFGIIGSGFMGRTYAEVISQYLENCELAALSGGKRAEQLAHDYHTRYLQNPMDLVALHNLDAIIVATPHATHAQYAQAAAQTGKHVLIEKPMAANLAACDSILQSCRQAAVVCGVAFTQRNRLCNVKAKSLLDSGQLGNILEIHECHVAPAGINALPVWQSEEDNLGVLFGHGIHCIDSIRWLTGREIRTVYAKCGSLTGKYPVEANSNVLMTLDDGTTATIHCSFEVPKPGFPRTQFVIQIICEEGLIDLDAYGECRVSLKGSEWTVVATQAPIDWQGKGFLDPVRLESYTAHLKTFVQAAGHETSPTATGWDGRQAVAVALAAYESNQNGKEVYPQ